jgi:hypothetical protein
MTDPKRYDTGRKTPPEKEEWPLIWRTLDKVEQLWDAFRPVVIVWQNRRLAAGLVGLGLAMNYRGVIEFGKMVWAGLVAFGGSP